MGERIGRNDKSAWADQIEIIADVEAIRRRLRAVARQCRAEVSTMQPGGARSSRALADALPRDLRMLERGVRMRVIYQHTARPDLATRSYVQAVSAAGADVRTTLELPDRLIIFDRTMAFLSLRSRPGQTPAAAVVRSAAVVTFLCRLFDIIWASAEPFYLDAPGYDGITDDLHRKIVRLLSQGEKDERIARRLGISVRTCRRHISKIVQQLGAISRFEAGVRAAQLGLTAPEELGEVHLDPR